MNYPFALPGQAYEVLKLQQDARLTQQAWKENASPCWPSFQDQQSSAYGRTGWLLVCALLIVLLLLNITSASAAEIVGVSDTPTNAVYLPLVSSAAKARPILFTSDRDGNREIYLMQPDGSGLTRLTNNNRIDDYAVLSPDGQKIAFSSDRTVLFQLWVMNVDGSGVTQVTQGIQSPITPSWSPDGQRIAFLSFRDGDVYVMNADGSALSQLTSNADWDGTPSWAHDGRQILFASKRDGNREVYVMNIDGTGQTRLLNHAADDSLPSW